MGVYPKRRAFLRVCMLCAVFLCVCRIAGADAMEVTASSAVLIDGESGRVLFEKNAYTLRPMASTTKIMTALVVLENASLEEVVVAGKNAHGVEGTSIYLDEGEHITVENALYGLMLASGNDVAVALAEHVSGDVPSFARLMTEHAEEMGLKATFQNPHGLDAQGHAASAYDMAMIAREALRHPEFQKIAATREKRIPWQGRPYQRVLRSKNRLLTQYEGATGVKTGFTSKAGRCLVFSATREGRTVVGAVLRAPNWFEEAKAIMDYGFSNYRRHEALAYGAKAGEVAVRGGSFKTVDALGERALAVPLATNERARLEVDLPGQVEAPVTAGQPLGMAYLLVNGDEVDRCMLLAARDVPANSFRAAIERVLKFWKIW